MDKEEIIKAIDWLKGDRNNYEREDHAYHYKDMAICALEQQLNRGWIPECHDGNHFTTVADRTSCEFLRGELTMPDIDRILAEVDVIHPYKIPGDFDTYSQYNEGWHDAVCEVNSRMETSCQLKGIDIG